ncbi:MAG TPA: hypothetical protein VLB27_11770, partial [candidate division Zixibacteria bacterium]|nr:hypothetical protein [candidate division Zixibacteria bacterium]
DFTNLRVFLPLDKDLPVYQKMKRRQAHERLRNEQTALRDLQRLPHHRDLFKAGAADWTISTAPLGGGGQFANLNLGAAALGGDLTLSGSGNSRTGFKSDELRGRWRYYVKDNTFVSQVIAGDVFTGGSLSRSLRGGLVSNAPLVQRRHFQSTTIEGEIEPEWEVEMYVDGKLKDFATTDQQGRYRFDMDIIYGASLVELKMYGPNGEIRTEERYIRVPFNLIPQGEWEYTVAAGSESGAATDALYSNGSAYYGISDWLTIGAGFDAPLERAEDKEPAYAGEIAAQIMSNLTVNGSLSPSNTYTGGFSYSQPSLVNLTGSYTKFADNPLRNLPGQTSRISLSLSSPLTFIGRNVGVRFNGSQDKFATFTTTNLNYGFNASIGPAILNYLGKYKSASRSAFGRSDLSSQLFATLQISRWLRPQIRVEYNHTTRELLKYGVFIGKRIFHTGQVSFSYERNHITGGNSFLVTLNLLTDFAQITSRALRIADQTSITQLYRGSVQFDQESGSVQFDRNNAVGYGAAVVRPFIDANFNGIRDGNEETLNGLRAKVRGAAGKRRGDNLYFYDRLRPYDEHLIEIDQTSLDDPTLRPAHENLQVLVNPNVVTTIDVPIVTASDISGSVLRVTPAGDVGAGGIKILLVNLSRDVVTEITTFNDGEYYYLGLLPGRYRAYIDQDQLAQYGYSTQPESIEFEIAPQEGGSSVEGINFLLLAR